MLGYVTKSLTLVAPALIPSWRFFDTIAASPRIEVAQLPSADAEAGDWQEFRPRPQSLSLVTILRRMVWNPEWNETLFLTSCAERLLDTPTEHSVSEISARVGPSLRAVKGAYFQFRIVLIDRDEGVLQKEIAYISAAFALPAP